MKMASLENMSARCFARRTARRLRALPVVEKTSPYVTFGLFIEGVCYLTGSITRVVRYYIETKLQLPCGSFARVTLLYLVVISTV